MVIRKRKGRFVVDYWMNGKRRKPGFNTRREAEAFAKSVQEEIESTQPIRGKYKTLKQAINLYIKTKTAFKSYKTRGNEKSYFEKLYTYLKDEHRIEFVHQVRREHLKLFQIYLAQDVINATVNRHFHCYKHFFSECETDGYLVSNPCYRLSALKEAKNPRQPWSKEQIEKMLNALPDWASEVFFTISAMGLRPGEACGLKVSDVDFDRRLVRAVSFKGTGEPQERFLPVPKAIMLLLQRKVHERGNDPSAYVFLNPSKEPVQTNYLARIVRLTRIELELPNLVSYGLRHGYLTELANMNVDLNAVRILAGHSSLKTTQNYLHTNGERLALVVEEFEKANLPVSNRSQKESIGGKNES